MLEKTNKNRLNFELIEITFSLHGYRTFGNNSSDFYLTFTSIILMNLDNEANVGGLVWFNNKNIFLDSNKLLSLTS